MTFEHAREYLARVLPWPQANEEPSYVNIHWTFVPKDGNIRKDAKGKPLLPWSGRAVASVTEAVKAIDWALKNPDTRDIYVCLSTQRDAQEKVSQKGWKYKTPIRNQPNAVALKSFFLDVDVKGGEHGYADLTEAVAALNEFLVKTNLPKPSVLVMSGGGLHVYWTLVEPLRPAQWSPLAHALAEATKQHGLKCDTQVTIDCARVLRVPDTLNRKTDPPLPVKLLSSGKGGDYVIERIAKCLEPYQTMAGPALPPLAPLPGISDLAAGIDQGNAAPVDLDSVAIECPFIQAAITSGGKDYTNPLWNLTTLISTFTQGGRTDAHRMADQHPGYSKESTDALFDRKTREKDQKGLGWPACQTISGSGCTACQGCAHFGAGKSPLHFAARPVVQQQATVGPLLPTAVTDLPDGYVRTPAGIIAVLTQQVDGTTLPMPICDYPMTDPWLQEDALRGLVLHFTTVTDLKKKKKVSIQGRIIAGQEMRPVLQEQGVFPYVGAKGVEAVARFLVAWIKKLQETKAAVITAPFGWSVDKASAQVEGFVFDNQLWTPNGPEVSGSPDGVLARQYAPSGSPTKWVDACKLITDQGRPELDAIVASAFAAPLVRFTGQPGVVMSAYSLESGIGKTTALRVAQSVWGDPIRAVQTLDDTQHSVLNKLGQLRSLPLYWDELKTEADVKKFVNIVFATTGGKEKSRLTRHIEQREPGAWQTLLVACSNDSIMDMVNHHCNTTAAGMLRVMEFVVTPPDANTPGQIDPSTAGLMLAALNDNHGHVGLKYAEWLGTDFAAIEKDMAKFMVELGVEVQAKNDERFWMACIATILQGAKYANQLGFTQFDEARLKDYMVTLLGNLRGYRRNTAVDMSQSLNVSDLFTQFMSAMRARHTLKTNRIHSGAGKPALGSIKTMGDTTRLDAIYVHVGVDDKIVRFSNFKMKEWLTEKGYARTTTMAAMVKALGAKLVNGKLGSGTHLSGGTERLWEIDLAGSPMASFIDDEA